MLDYPAFITSESARMGAVAGTALDAPVPTCPGWSVADLAWHVVEGQEFWLAVIGGHVEGFAEFTPPERPAAADIPGRLADVTPRLVEELSARDPGDACWSWHADGGTIGWVRRRQAHEMLIHRIDAELAAGARTPVDGELGADGIDEILHVMLDIGELPPWAEFRPDGATVRIETGDQAWTMELGRFVGEPPDGDALDLPALALVDSRPENTAVVTGSGPDIDLWLWGRGSIDGLTVEGDREAAIRLRAVAADATR